jgi:glycosyltransferase involved in cell wall biosynthesis
MVTLSVLIPTFNRSASLSQLLRRLSRLDSDALEIVVSNNASTDDTEDVLREIAPRWAGRTVLRIHHQSSNLGFDGNLATLLELANGKYVYFLSDDDQPNISRLRRLLDDLKGSKAGVVLTHHFWNSRAARRFFAYMPMVPLSGSPISVQLKFGAEATVRTREEKIALIMLCGQISTAVYLRPITAVDDLANQMRRIGGGVAHYLLADACLESTGSYRIAKRSWIKIGPKTGFSDWFMASTLFGAPALLHMIGLKSSNKDFLSIYSSTEYARWSLHTFDENALRESLSETP